MTKIVKSWPPNVQAIKAVFPNLTGREVFAYAGTIYNPGGAVLGPELIAHERVHFDQQGDDPLGWWTKYLADPEFRLSQEVQAHRAEWQALKTLRSNPKKRTRALHALARRLCGPLYANAVTYTDAKALILEEAP